MTQEEKQTMDAIYQKQRADLARLQSSYNVLLRQLAARDTFVRWFAAEYGLETFGRRGDEMRPETPVGVGAWVGKFRHAIGRIYNG